MHTPTQHTYNKHKRSRTHNYVYNYGFKYYTFNISEYISYCSCSFVEVAFDDDDDDDVVVIISRFFACKQCSNA